MLAETRMWLLIYFELGAGSSVAIRNQSVPLAFLITSRVDHALAVAVPRATKSNTHDKCYTCSLRRSTIDWKFARRKSPRSIINFLGSANYYLMTHTRLPNSIQVLESKTKPEKKESLGDQHKFARWFMGRSAPLANVCIEQAKKEKKFNFRRGFNLWSRYSLSLGTELQLKCSEWKDEFLGSDRKWKITFECMICYGVDEKLKPELVVESSNVY